MSWRSYAYLPQDVLIKVFQYFTDVRDLCASSEVCLAWNTAALSPDCWSDVRAVDGAFHRRSRSKEDTGSLTFDCIACFDQPTKDPCEECKPLSKKPPKLAGKRKRKNAVYTRAHRRGVSLAVDVITRRAGDRLRSLNLHDCYPFYYLADYQMQNADLDVLADRCGARLCQLAISPSVHLSGYALVTFAQACPRLRVLHMTHCQTLMVSHMNAIVAACPVLEDISVSHCPRFRGQRLMQILEPLRNTLRRINLSFTPTEALNVTQVLSFPVLEHVIAEHCSNLKAVITANCGSVQDIASMPSTALTTLSVDDTLFDPSLFLLLFRNSRNLQCLSANCIPVPSWPVLDCAFDGYVPPLRTLCVSNLPVSDNTWMRIYQRLRDTLEFCDVSINPTLTLKLPKDNGIFCRLEGITISVTGVTDVTLAELLLRAPSVTYIRTAGCRGVIDRRFRRNPLLFRPYLHKIIRGEDVEDMSGETSS